MIEHRRTLQEKKRMVFVSFDTSVSEQWTQSNYQPLWQQKQMRTYRKGSPGEDCWSLRLEYVFLSRWSSSGFPLFPVQSRSGGCPLSAVFPPLIWMENVVPTEERKRAGLERLDNPSDQSAIDMITIYCFEPIVFRSHRRAVCLLVGWVKTSQLKVLEHREKSWRNVSFTFLQLQNKAVHTLKA